VSGSASEVECFTLTRRKSPKFKSW
jgi:hypothetical protein